MNFQQSRGFALGLAVLVPLFPTASFAQSASQLTPPSFRPTTERPSGFALPGTPGLATPAGAEKLFVSLAGVSVEGGLPQLAAATAALEAQLTHGKVSGAEVFAAARELEANYAKAGYVLVRVILPPQRLVDGGRLKLRVVDGFIERVDVENVPAPVRARILHLVSPLTGRRGVTLPEIERRVLLAGDTPGVLLRSTLAPGKALGGTVLVLEAKYQATSETESFDNTVSAALGTTTVGTGLAFNSVTGLGETVYLNASGHPESGDNGLFSTHPRNRTLAGGVVVPLPLDGLSLNAEYTDARTTPFPTAGIGTTDTFDRLSLRLRYAWLRSRLANFNTEASFDAEDETNSLFLGSDSLPLSEDRLRVLRLAADGDLFTPWGGSVSGRAVASFGLDGLGARSAADATPTLPLSRQGADDTFHKLNINLAYGQPLLEHLALSFIAQAQTSFGEPLLSAEQFNIANGAGLSAFDAGSIVGDDGFVVRGQLASPWQVQLPATELGVVATPYLFAAYGEVSLADPTALEAGSTRATSWGAGVTLGEALPGTLSTGSLTLEYGHGTISDGPPSDRITLATAFKF